MKPYISAAFLLCGILFSGNGGDIFDCQAGVGPEPSMKELERRFHDLPMDARELCGPLFWLHGDDSKERLEHFVEKVAEGGNGSLTTESRPHNDWLGEGWYRDVDICLQAAKKQGLKLWIFDEKWWPSQSVGGKVPARYGAKQLETSSVDVEGPKAYRAEGFSGQQYIGTVAGRMDAGGRIEGQTLTDLAPQIQAGVVSWPVPAGRWKIMKFTHGLAPALGQGGGKELSVDGMSQDCVDWYLQTVYQPHYDRFKADFGKTILGFFYDEPETRGDWGTELNRVLAERGVDWKKAYVGYKYQLAGGEQEAARYQYLEARVETWGRTMYGSITRWCEARGVKSIGHFMEQSKMYMLPDFCGGDLMRLQKYSSMGGIDAVFSQFKPGQREAYDTPCWQTPKLGSSVTHAYGKPEDITMVEIFGARGQDLPYPEMKWWTDHMQVSGVNFLIPHSFNPRAPHDTDCPPYFYMEQYEPRWPLYRVFADYTTRLSVMLTGGRHVAPVALLFPGNTAQVGKTVTPEQMSESLQDALYDCDWLPFEVFEKDVTVHGKALQLRAESYRVLVIPPTTAIPYDTLQKAKQYFDQGGVVVGYGFLPSKSSTLGRTGPEIVQLVEAIWGQPSPGLKPCRSNAAQGRSYFLPEKPTPEQLQQVLAGDAGIHPTLEVLEGKTDHWLHVLHRVKSGRDVFLIANQNHLGEARTFRFRALAKGYPEVWDAMRNEIRSIPFRRAGNAVEFSLRFEPNESVLVTFQPSRRKLPGRETEVMAAARRTYSVDRLPFPVDAAARPLPKGPTSVLEGARWVWFPEATAAQAATPGTRWFRKTVDLPSDRTVTKASFTGTADNSFTLFLNGKSAGQGDSSAEGWRNPTTLDVLSLLRKGSNLLAIEAVNGSDKSNPAGVIGCLVVEFGEGTPLLVRLDGSWKASADKVEGWNTTGFDDHAWQATREVAKFGDGPWGKLSGSGMTVGPVPADPFLGRVKVAAKDVGRRLSLELGELAPEEAARVTVNGHYAGGFIGKPLRLDVSRWIKGGENSIQIEPFAPNQVRLVVY